jgi:hypothetical protein
MQRILQRVLKAVVSSVVIFGLVVFYIQFRREAFEEMTCGRFPKEANIKIDNQIWQVMELSFRGSVKILNAYLDEREYESVVRVNVISPRLEIKEDQIYCQFWDGENSQPFIVKPTDYKILWWTEFEKETKYFVPYFINCHLPKYMERIPTSVSLATDPCDHATNNVKITNNQPVKEKKKFGVCSKAAYYSDPKFTIRFIEWVHWMLLLGAEKIHFSIKTLHPEFMKAVEYFESQGVVETWPYYEPSGIHRDDTNFQTWMTEENDHNDCFYRVKHLYEYLLILDFDEVLVPTNEEDKNWSDLMEKTNGSEYDTVRFQLYLMAKNESKAQHLPEYMYTLRNFFFYDLPRDVGKSILKTESVVVTNTHTSMFCMKDCRRLEASSEFGRVLHYRDDVSDRESLQGQNATQLFRYQDELIRRVNETMQVLKLDL